MRCCCYNRAPVTEKAIQDGILLASGDLVYLRIWRANVGKARPIGSNRVVMFGVRGQADLTGVLACGLRVEVEVKTPIGRVSKDQRRYLEMIERMGGVAVIARSVDGFLARIQDHVGNCPTCAEFKGWTYTLASDEASPTTR